MGITARVLADLGRLQEPESQIVLGAAVLDDVLGLVILSVVEGYEGGQAITVLSVAKTMAIAFGFLIVTLLVGQFAVRWLFRLAGRLNLRTRPLVGAAAGVRPGLAGARGRLRPDHRRLCRRPVAGADGPGPPHRGGCRSRRTLLRTVLFHDGRRGRGSPRFNPLNPGSGPILLLGGLLIVAGVVGKFLAGYAPFWFKGRKSVIGVAMIPRGEVGLIFAQMGLASGVFDAGRFSAVALMVMVTTFLAPPLLKLLFASEGVQPKPPPPAGVAGLVTEP